MDKLKQFYDLFLLFSTFINELGFLGGGVGKCTRVREASGQA